ncbi:nitrate reductase [Rubrivivax rivuli]|uniref:nitrate reductase n=1 Tax=Rubrivivax rivuli TaxID=1862385 RepID=UPI001FDF6EEE|nr:nitrate reductase [Rubrivivax rivuli]
MPPVQATRSTCPYCGVGCGVVIESRGAQITGVRGDPDHPANFGRLCTKGQTLHLTAAAHLQPQLRALQPMRRAARDQPLLPVAWDVALDEVAQRFAQIAEESGPDALGLYLSGQLLTEDYYVFNKLAKGLLGTNNVDTNSRLCMSSAVAGYKQSLGADAPPNCYEDLDHAATVFITGSNMAWAHPVLFRRLEDARRANPAQRWIVADPRRTETAALADLHLQLLPGTDVVLYHALLHVMLWEGLTDPAFIAAHTTGFEALRDRVREFSPAVAAKTCGLKAEDIVQAARWIAGVQADGPRAPTLSLWCQGLNQSSSGTDKNSALINLHLATGQIGRPGAGPFSLTGQPNAMGGREVGGLANLLSAHRDLANPAHREEVAAFWGVQVVPAVRGKSAVQMFEAAAEGEIRALWIACTNPAQSLPNQAVVRRALQRAEFVVLQEAYTTTATAGYADLLLPASTWGEKEGTVTNSERRISRVRAAVPAPGQARADWAIAADVAQRLEKLRPPARWPGWQGETLFPYRSAEDVWNEHRESTRGRDLDITGLSYAQLEAAPQQWPLREGETTGAARLYADGVFPTPDGRARFVAPAWRNVAEPRDARYPVALNTGRLRDQWHGASRTGTLGRLFAHSPEPVLELHPQELARRRWLPGKLVRVASRRGALVLPVAPSEAVAPAQAFIAMHWGGEWLSGGGVNTLTSDSVCPTSHQPELKHAAVRLEPAALPWQMAGGAWWPAEQAWARREALRAVFAAIEAAGGYAHCVPFGREFDPAEAEALATAPAEAGLRWRAALPATAEPALLQAVAAALGLDPAQGPLLQYADPRLGQTRRLALRPDGTLRAYLLAGDTAADAWVLPLLLGREPAAAYGRALLAARAVPPDMLAQRAPRSPQVCACFDVSEARIVQAAAQADGTPAQRLQAVQQALHCGTRCGSCLPAVKGLLQRTPCAPPQAASAPQETLA